MLFIHPVPSALGSLTVLTSLVCTNAWSDYDKKWTVCCSSAAISGDQFWIIILKLSVFVRLLCGLSSSCPVRHVSENCMLYQVFVDYLLLVYNLRRLIRPCWSEPRRLQNRCQQSFVTWRYDFDCCCWHMQTCKRSASFKILCNKVPYSGL